MIYTDRKGFQRYFDVDKNIKVASNLDLYYLVSQLNGGNRDAQILKQSLLRQMKLNDKKSQQDEEED